MNATFTYLNFDLSFDDSDVVNPNDFCPKGEYNPHNVRPWLLHDHGFTVAIVFASCLQDALDEATDAGKLDRFMVSRDEYNAMTSEEQEELDYLGGAGEPFDIEGLDALVLTDVPFSFAAMFAAANAKELP